MPCQHRFVSGGECLECQNSVIKTRLNAALKLLHLWSDNRGNPETATAILLSKLDPEGDLK